jgi:hypothetical protein
MDKDKTKPPAVEGLEGECEVEVGVDVDMDPLVRPFVDALNGLPGIDTYSSCGGHEAPKVGQAEDGRFFICFDVREGPTGRPIAMAWDSLALAEVDGEGKEGSA